MLFYVRGNLLFAPAQTLVNPVNGAGALGAGLALAFRRRYPDMEPAYREACRRGELRPGGFHLFRAADHWIYNFPTKRHWRDRARLEDIEAGLATFTAVYRELGITSVAFPRLGCGLGGLDWEREVRPLMERVLVPLPIPVLVCTIGDHP